MFDGVPAARRFAYEMVHGRTDEPNSSFGIHEYLVKNETELAFKIGNPGITTRQKETL